MPNKLNREQFDDIVEAFENAGFETRPYTGRGGWGRKESLGINCEKPLKTLLETIAYVAERAEEADDVSTFIDNLGTPESDSMGRDAILYFPEVEYQYDED